MYKKIVATLSSTLENKWWGYPLLLLLVGLATYGYVITQLGFYWDDWEVVYLTQLASWQELISYAGPFRPSWPYLLYNAILGINPVSWHLLTLFLRCGGILLLYQALLSLWPARKFELRWMGLLLLVYPGFLEQSFSATYTRQFSSFLLFTLSIYLSVLAVRARSFAWIFWIGAFITGVTQMFTVEYYAMLELIRPIILWLSIREDARPKKLLHFMAHWLPFLLAFAYYIWWRVIYAASLTTDLGYEKVKTPLLSSPIDGIFNLTKNGFFDSFYLIFQAWVVNTYNPNILNFSAKMTYIGLLLGFALAWLAFVSIRSQKNSGDRFFPQAFLLGWLALLLGAVPVWGVGKLVTGRGIWDDRFSLAPMIGAVLLIVMLITLMVRVRWRAVLLSVMFVSAILTQVVTVNKYRLDWENQRNLYWQLSWRAPNLMPNTAIYSMHIPLVTLPDYDASYALTALYAENKPGTNIPYWLFTAERISELKIIPGKPLKNDFRTMDFRGNTADGIAISYQPSRGCLQVLSPIFQAGGQSSLIALSNLTRIQADSKHVPNPVIFGQEPARDWCYYFEKGDLARQLGDWSKTISLYKQAVSLNFSPANGEEYMPFIDAYAQKGNFDEALRLSVLAQKTTAGLEPMLCANWQRLSQSLSAPDHVLEKARAGFGCSW